MATPAERAALMHERMIALFDSGRMRCTCGNPACRVLCKCDCRERGLPYGCSYAAKHDEPVEHASECRCTDTLKVDNTTCEKYFHKLSDTPAGLLRSLSATVVPQTAEQDAHNFRRMNPIYDRMSTILLNIAECDRCVLYINCHDCKHPIYPATQ